MFLLNVKWIIEGYEKIGKCLSCMYVIVSGDFKIWYCFFKIILMVNINKMRNFLVFNIEEVGWLINF